MEAIHTKNNHVLNFHLKKEKENMGHSSIIAQLPDSGKWGCNLILLHGCMVCAGYKTAHSDA